MNYFIGIETLVPNAFIELYPKKSISAKAMENYGYKIIEKLGKMGHRPLLELNRDLTSEFLREYKMYFDLIEVNNENYFILKDGITKDELIMRARKFLPVDILFAVMDPDVVNESLINNQEKILVKKNRY